MNYQPDHKPERPPAIGAVGPGLWGRSIWAPVLLLLILYPVISVAQPPPEYTTINREQSEDFRPDEDKLLRIWMVDVGQGEGIIIQLPGEYAYTVEDVDDPPPERVDILIDGGSWTSEEAELIGAFLDRLYPDNHPIIEHTVITHHDKDHISGLTNLLNDTNRVFEAIYHNGLATYRRGHLGFPEGTVPEDAAVFSKNSRGELTRGMAFLDSNGKFETRYLINSLSRLRSYYNSNHFDGDYEKLARAILDRPAGKRVRSFVRAYVGSPFILENSAEDGLDLSDFEIEVLWPLKKLQAYPRSSWSKTINGNSVTFRLKYGEFEMLFTGDLNKNSQKVLMKYLEDNEQTDKLSCDVFKVPHHGSKDIFEDFYADSNFNPVISVAAMGESGFRSSGHKHPRPEIIKMLGGPHRVFCTFIHERKFSWNGMTNKRRKRMIEKRRKNILVETDGEWFRVVELRRKDDLNYPPPVSEIRRGHGTRWIRASEGGQ